MTSKVKTVVRKRLGITLHKNCVDWLDKNVEAHKYFSNSHTIEVLILEAMKEKRE